MLLNDDFTARALVHAASLDWTPSPSRGVERRMLFRMGEEKARATSIVRYAADSHFARHGHPGGEDFLVLEGVFQDETGDFPAGTYVRNPPGTGHAPKSAEGCTIFVKLWQFRQDDSEPVTRRPGEGKPAALRSGVLSSAVLFEGADERVVIEEWRAGAPVEIPNPEGLELLLLAGSFQEDQDMLVPLSWMRLPPGQDFHALSGPGGARVWYKQAPLLHRNVCAFDDAQAGKKAF